MAMQKQGRFYAVANGEIVSKYYTGVIARVCVENLSVSDACEITDAILAALDAKFPDLVDAEKG